jgi:hypothetical protein
MHWRLRHFMDHIMHFNLSGYCLATVTAFVLLYCVSLCCFVSVCLHKLFIYFDGIPALCWLIEMSVIVLVLALVLMGLIDLASRCFRFWLLA